jgi:hypothetical protein
LPDIDRKVAARARSVALQVSDGGCQRGIEFLSGKAKTDDLPADEHAPFQFAMFPTGPIELAGRGVVKSGDVDR